MSIEQEKPNQPPEQSKTIPSSQNQDQEEMPAPASRSKKIIVLAISTVSTLIGLYFLIYSSRCIFFYNESCGDQGMYLVIYLGGLVVGFIQIISFILSFFAAKSKALSCLWLILSLPLWIFVILLSYLNFSLAESMGIAVIILFFVLPTTYLLMRNKS